MGGLEDLGVEPSGSFVLRTPALPYDDFVTLRGASGDRASGAQRERLRAAVARPEVRDAVFVASPRIAELLDRWLDDPEESADRKVEHALVRYFSRMTARATPFGLFAGCTCGRVGDATVLHLSGLEDYRRHTRLDMEYLSALVEELERDAEVRAALEYRPNSSLYLRGGKLCYAEARTDEGGRSHYLVAAADSPYLRAALRRASSGARPHELAEALVDDDVSLDEAQGFVDELIDSHILVSELTPPVTGDEPIEALVPTLARYPVTAEAGARLSAARGALDDIDSRGVGVERAAYLDVAATLEKLPATVSLSRLFQVDMVKPAEGLSLGARVVEETARAVQILHRMSARTGRDDALGRFRSAFRERYGNREVPLFEALDEELGIGFDVSTTPSAEASPLLAGLPFAAQSDDLAPWRRRDQLLLGKVIEAARAGRAEIALTHEDLDELSVDPPPLPEAFSVNVAIAAASAQHVDRGDFSLLFQGLYGPSGGRLMGRFCHADPEQHALLQEHLAQEEALHPEIAYAEIVHLPEGRLGNILLRPVLRSYEIPYLGRSGAPPDRQLPVQDLLVSVDDERIVLRSERLDREVWPRLTTAHNYTWRSLGVYRFLCALQAQGTRGALQWDWGVLEGAPFLPRVRAGRIVLARAAWLVPQRDLRALEGSGRDGWDEWRRERTMPRLVALADADNELIVDWDNVLSVESFLALVRNRPAVRLVEVWPDEDQLVVTAPEGRFRHEILIPFVASRPTVPARAPAPRGKAGARRSFPPGSEWLYAKLYTGSATADAVLRDAIRPSTRSWAEAGAVDSWFFIRYGDPHWHVRLRLHGRPERLANDVLPELQAVAGNLLDAGAIRSVQLDTYEREVERYGGPEGVELAEEIFHADSDACLGILAMISGDAGMDARWRLTLRGADLLLDDFGFSPSEKSAVMRSLRDSFAAEFGASGELKKRVGARYRQEKLVLDALLEDRAAPEMEAALRLLHERSPSVRRTALRLRDLAERGVLSRPLEDIASSVVHMHANRLLRSAARAQEMVIYDLLDRLYLARAKRRG